MARCGKVDNAGNLSALDVQKNQIGPPCRSSEVGGPVRRTPDPGSVLYESLDFLGNASFQQFRPSQL